MNNLTFNKTETIFSDTLPSNSGLVSNSINHINSGQTLYIKNMVHEINNVLCLINSSLQIIESSHPETKNFKYWNTTMDDVQHLINLMSEISSFNNSSSVNPELVDLTLQLNSIIESFTSNKDYSNVSIQLSTANNIPLILADKTKLKQVFINIIKNALESFDDTKTKPTIMIDINSSDKNILITISDNGCGISSDKIESIFLPMVSYKSSGSGLGLPISKKIIEAHKGTLKVESTIDYGTSFYISLPI